MEMDEQMDILEERIELAENRIAQMESEQLGSESLSDYFRTVGAFLKQILETRRFLLAGGLESAPIRELRERNRALYEDILPEHYGKSYANPTVAVNQLGEEYGQLLCFLYTELRSLIGFVYEGETEEIAIRLELFLEVYNCFWYEWNENRMLPAGKSIQEILYWFVSDYADMSAEKKIEKLVTEGNRFAADIIRQEDLSDERYLYKYGEYISENERKLAEFMATLPEETIATMADTYTEGYRIGFEVTGKDLSRKKIVEIRYRVGFERMLRKALQNFEGMGLKPAIYRNPSSILYNPSIFKTGFYGGEANRQFDFDHKDDKALFLDKNYVNRRLEVLRTAFEEYREAALLYAGPAVVETFGEKEFEPVNKKEAVSLREKQNALWLEFRSASGEIQRKYILEEERSFTIIAFPIPEIGDVFEELFEETIRINTLDYKLYQGIQQTIIDTLNQAEYCRIVGMNGNCTDLTVQLYPLQDPEKETKFENCVADVNIPVGEVFTSPVLKGTNGILHVSRVYLNGLEYKDLQLEFKDGMTAGYSCANFGAKEENEAFIRENVLFRHESLPMGEFAIGTNTTAYMVAKKLGVEAKLPILIAEKMGPHFAVGDTCYSHVEDIRVYNPDGKEIVARENEVAALRKTRPEKAYFNCHTDITIPYDELGSLSAVKANGEEILIIEKGRFVLPGTEALNEAFDSDGE